MLPTDEAIVLHLSPTQAPIVLDALTKILSDQLTKLASTVTSKSRATRDMADAGFAKMNGTWALVNILRDWLEPPLRKMAPAPVDEGEDFDDSDELNG